MKIWVIGRAYPSSLNNNSGSFEFEQARMLADRGHSVCYFAVETVMFYRKNRRAGISFFTSDGIRIYEDYFPYHPLPPFIMLRLREWRYKRLFDIAEKSYGIPDVIHVHYPAMAGYQQIIPYAERGVKIVATEHWTRVLTNRIRHVHIESLKNYIKYAEALISVGSILQERIRTLTKCGDNCGKLMVIPNIVPASFTYSPAPATQPFRFIAIGRLVPCKCFDLLIQAFEKAFDENENVELHIVGGGPEYNTLLQLIKDKGLDGRVFLTGSRPHEDIPVLIQNAHVLVCSSNLETFGVPVIEAMACGRPVITTDAIGFVDLINDRVGAVIKKDSLKELTEALKEMHRCYQKYDGLAISEYALSKFSEDAVYAELMRIYGDHQSQDNIV